MCLVRGTENKSPVDIDVPIIQASFYAERYLRYHRIMEEGHVRCQISFREFLAHYPEVYW
jgi:hypothetical protein